MAVLKVFPSKILVDETPQIVLYGLGKNESVTIVSHMRVGQKDLLAFGHYRTDHTGSCNNETSLSLGGTFTGLEPNGLFWSMQVPGDKLFATRLMVRDVTVPMTTDFYVLRGHVKVEHVPHGGSVLCTGSIQRTYMADHVVRTRIRVGRVRGTLFVPNYGKGRYNGVIDLFGTAGGILEHRACLLASRGFTALALPFFAYEDLPTNFTPADLTYFEEAVDWLSGHDNVRGEGIGMVGVSLGANHAMFTSMVSSKVHAVVAIAGFHANVNCDLTYHGRRFPVALGNYDLMVQENDIFNIRRVYFEAHDVQDYAVKLEESQNAHFMFVHGTDDQNTDCSCSLLLAQRLRKYNKDNFEMHIYTGAGHLIEPPYTFFCRTVYNKFLGLTMDFGGSPAGHARAQQDHWKHLLRFLRQHLNKDKSSSSLSSHL